MEPNRQGHLNDINSNEIEIKFTKTSHLAQSCVVSNECTHVADESSVVSCERNNRTFSLDTHRINHIIDSLERHDYVLNRFDEMDDDDMDPEDYHGMMTNVDAQADSFIGSPEPQAYLLHITVTDDIISSQEIIESITYAQVVNPSNKFHKELQFAVE